MNFKYYLKFWLDVSKKKIITEQFDSIYDINFKENDVELVVFDIDDTLGENEGLISDKTLKLIENLEKENIMIALVSNSNLKRMKYLDSIFLHSKVMIITNADKPNPKILLDVLKKQRVEGRYAIMVGDKVSTDLYSAYLAGITRRYLVTPYSELYGGLRASLIYRYMRRLENWASKNI